MEGLEEGLEKGLEKGREEGHVDVARNALSKGLPIDVVQQITGLSKETLSALQA
jgi:predicted transposase/invertase (TIGR01784 family)